MKRKEMTLLQRLALLLLIIGLLAHIDELREEFLDELERSGTNDNAPGGMPEA